MVSNIQIYLFNYQTLFFLTFIHLIIYVYIYFGEYGFHFKRGGAETVISLTRVLYLVLECTHLDIDGDNQGSCYNGAKELSGRCIQPIAGYTTRKSATGNEK